MYSLNAALSRFWCEYRLQLRMTVFRWSYLVMHILLAVILIALFGTRSDRPAEGMLAASVGTVSTSMMLLVAILLAGISASRASQEHFSEIAHTLPAGIEMVLAGILATLTAVVGLLVEPLALAAWVGPLDSFVAGLFPFCWYIIAAVFLGSAFTWWLATWLRFRRWTYPLLAAAWAVFLLSPMLLSRAGVPGMQLIDLINRMQGIDYDSLFGRQEPPAIGTWFCLFFASLGLIFTSLAIWNQLVHRFNRKVFPGLLAAAVCVGLSVTYAVNFYAALDTLNQQAAENQIPIESSLVEMGSESVLAYQVSVDITPLEPVIRVEMDIRNDGKGPVQSLTLALNHNFKVVSASVPYQRAGDSLTLTLSDPLEPGQSRSFSLVYQGALSVYGFGAQIISEILHQGAARLGLASLWLPVAGAENLAQLEHNGALAAPVAIQLSVKKPEKVQIYSNLPETSEAVYSSPETNWVFWLASPRLVSRKVGSIQIYTASSDLGMALRYADRIDRFYHTAKAFFPAVKADQATMLVIDKNFGFPYASELSTGGQPILITQRILLSYWNETYNSTAHMIAGELLSSFYQMSGGISVSRNDQDSIARFLWVYSDNEGDPEAMQSQYINISALETVLLNTLAASGPEGLQQALDALRSAPANEEDDRQSTAAWLEERMNVH